MDKKPQVDKLTKEMPLAPLDYTTPQNYMMNALEFPFLGTETAERQTALVYLGGQFVHGNGYDELPRLLYIDDPANHDFFPAGVFDSQVLDASQFPWTFDQLLDDGVPAAALKKTLFLLLPQSDPRPGEACHTVTLRVSFIDGGLVLGFACLPPRRDGRHHKSRLSRVFC